MYIFNYYTIPLILSAAANNHTLHSICQINIFIIYLTTYDTHSHNIYDTQSHMTHNHI